MISDNIYIYTYIYIDNYIEYIEYIYIYIHIYIYIGCGKWMRMDENGLSPSKHHRRELRYESWIHPLCAAAQ